ncbi:elicitor-responsive protein 1-like [Quercus lobata]|nr:elicitor-responsive protein 1-like [Quercus lobata]
MSIIGIQGQILEVTVVGCNKLKDTEWISKQDPYVCLEYSSAKYRTKTCTDGGKNPTFNHKFKLELIEGYVEIKIMVWNENKVTSHKFIGSGRVLLQKVLSQGFDDDTWPLQTTSGRYAGEVKLVLHYSNSLKPSTTISFSPSALPYVTQSIPQVPPFPIPPPAPAATYAVHYSSSCPYSSYPNSSYPPPTLPTNFKLSSTSLTLLSSPTKSSTTSTSLTLLSSPTIPSNIC